MMPGTAVGGSTAIRAERSVSTPHHGVSEPPGGPTHCSRNVEKPPDRPLTLSHVRDLRGGADTGRPDPRSNGR